MVEQAQGLVSTEELSLAERVEQLERVLRILTSDQAIGNVLKGPFRLPDKAQPSRAFQ